MLERGGTLVRDAHIGPGVYEQADGPGVRRASFAEDQASSRAVQPSRFT